jgi:vacuolar-type H+-ATPase subunit B/Vma2
MSKKDIEYTTVTEVAGPLMIVDNIEDVAYNSTR